MPHHVIEPRDGRFEHARQGREGKPPCSFWALPHKPDVDDCRESPAFELMELLQDRGANVAYSDPHVPILPAPRPLDPPGILRAHRGATPEARLRPDRHRPQGLRLGVRPEARVARHRHPRATRNTKTSGGARFHRWPDGTIRGDPQTQPPRRFRIAVRADLETIPKDKTQKNRRQNGNRRSPVLLRFRRSTRLLSGFSAFLSFCSSDLLLFCPFVRPRPRLSKQRLPVESDPMHPIETARATHSGRFLGQAAKIARCSTTRRSNGWPSDLPSFAKPRRPALP